MPGTSFLSAGDAEAIRQARRDLLATQLELQDPDISVSFRRYNPANDTDTVIPAQVVLLRYASQRMIDKRRSEGAAENVVTGTMRREAPFDVQVGDLFTLPSGEAGQITGVQPPRGGIVRAVWELAMGRS